MNNFYIDTDTGLKEICEKLKGSEFLALDTEFIRERTYYAQLCLLQIANEDVIACIDPLAINDLRPLRELLYSETSVKVVHAAHQDMEIFYYLWGELPKPVYDTQIAATLLGFGESIGYASLITKMLSINLDKSHTRTDWSQRPLTEKQLSYAADDVRYLAQVYPIQKQKLESLGRLAWLAEDFQELSQIDRYVINPDDVWRKVKGIRKLKRSQLAIVQSLAAWRENQAIKQDKPRRRVLGDEVIVDLTRLRPSKLSDFNNYRGITTSVVKTHGETLIKLIAAAQQRPESEWPLLPPRTMLSANEEAVIDAMTALVKLISAETDITASTLATRKDLEQLLRGQRDSALVHGWRHQYVGQTLQAFLEGNLTLAMADGHLTSK